MAAFFTALPQEGGCRLGELTHLTDAQFVLVSRALRIMSSRSGPGEVGKPLLASVLLIARAHFQGRELLETHLGSNSEREVELSGTRAVITFGNSLGWATDSCEGETVGSNSHAA
jgi:hypothetical protein